MAPSQSSSSSTIVPTSSTSSETSTIVPTVSKSSETAMLKKRRHHQNHNHNHKQQISHNSSTSIFKSLDQDAIIDGIKKRQRFCSNNGNNNSNNNGGDDDGGGDYNNIDSNENATECFGLSFFPCIHNSDNTSE
jgi:hypothetical protein